MHILISNAILFQSSTTGTNVHTSQNTRYVSFQNKHIVLQYKFDGLNHSHLQLQAMFIDSVAL